MTKMTTLHFASPFAFSMPAPEPSSTRQAHATLLGRRGDTQATTAWSGSTDALSTLLDAAPAATSDGAEAHTGSEGFADSAFATALRRYLEQQGDQTGVGSEAPETEIEDETSPD